VKIVDSDVGWRNQILHGNDVDKDECLVRKWARFKLLSRCKKTTTTLLI